MVVAAALTVVACTSNCVPAAITFLASIVWLSVRLDSKWIPSEVAPSAIAVTFRSVVVAVPAPLVALKTPLPLAAVLQQTLSRSVAPMGEHAFVPALKTYNLSATASFETESAVAVWV